MTDKQAIVEVIAAVGMAIKELKEVPSGHLYARVMNYLTLEQYEQIISALIQNKLVERKNHLLRWIEKVN